MKSQTKQQIEIIARAVVLIKNKILLCQMKNRDWCFLPGGHAEFGEKTEQALIRELKEELGQTISQPYLIGVVENFYNDNVDNQQHHELNLIFKAEIKNPVFKSKEDHIDFILCDIKSLSKQNLLPEHLKQALMSWLKDKKFFWRSNL